MSQSPHQKLVVPSGDRDGSNCQLLSLSPAQCACRRSQAAHNVAHTHTHTHFVTVIKRTKPTVDRRQAGTDQNDSSGHNYKIVMEARRLFER